MWNHSPLPQSQERKPLFFCQCHPHLFNYFSPIAFHKALPSGSLFTQNSWVSTSISCTSKTGGSQWTWMRYSKFWSLICQVTGLMCYLCGAAISSLRHPSFWNVVNAPICYGELLLHAKPEFKVVHGILPPQNIGRQLSAWFLVGRKLLLGVCVPCHVNISVAPANIFMVMFFHLPQRS